MKQQEIRCRGALLALAIGVSVSSCARSDVDATPPLTPAAGSRANDPHDPTLLLYDSNTVEAVSGTIKSVEQVESQRNTGAAIVQLVIVDGATVRRVRLGPAWFVGKQDIELDPGAFVNVTGSRITLSGTEVILASSVLKDNRELRLRDTAGFPVWLAVRQRR
jgi:hypothetical protein